MRANAAAGEITRRGALVPEPGGEDVPNPWQWRFVPGDGSRVAVYAENVREAVRIDIQRGNRIARLHLRHTRDSLHRSDGMRFHTVAGQPVSSSSLPSLSKSAHASVRVPSV